MSKKKVEMSHANSSSTVELILIKPRGFCAGVRRAINIVEMAIKKFGSPVWVKHSIVHNRHVIQNLKKLGAIFVEDIEDVPDGKVVVYSAHGVSPQVRQRAKEKELIEVDATCVLVNRIHEHVSKYYKMGYNVIVIGHANHVEVKAICDEAPGKAFVVKSVEDVDGLKFSKHDKLFYVTQTTFSVDDVSCIVDFLETKFPNIETFSKSSICYATTNRQRALLSVCNDVDIVLVVGDPSSSNSNRLKELAEKHGAKSYLVDSEKDLKEEWFYGSRRVCVTAGASTPEHVVQNCITQLLEFDITFKEELTVFDENVNFKIPDFLN